MHAEAKSLTRRGTTGNAASAVPQEPSRVTR